MNLSFPGPGLPVRAQPILPATLPSTPCAIHSGFFWASDMGDTGTALGVAPVNALPCASKRLITSTIALSAGGTDAGSAT